MSKKSKVTLGAIIGAAAGLVVGLFLMPKTGKSARRMNIKTKVKQLKRKAKKLQKSKGKK